MRCASYQEDGFPAGRWRLPTTAEIMFIINLQGDGAIKNLFYGGNSYYSSTDLIKTKNETSNGVTTGGFDSYNTSDKQGSVRCVYDEWYWGSEREAQLKYPDNPGYDGWDKYLFTWGDEQR